MEQQDLVVGVHVMVAVAIAAFGLYRVSRGQRIPGLLNVGMAAAVVGVGVYMGRVV
jgi:hypothetical protein